LKKFPRDIHRGNPFLFHAVRPHSAISAV